MGKRGRPRVVNCKVCGRHVDECGPLSARKKCDACGVGRSIAQQYGMAYGDTDEVNHWRARMAASIGATLNEELPTDAAESSAADAT